MQSLIVNTLLNKDKYGIVLQNIHTYKIYIDQKQEKLKPIFHMPHKQYTYQKYESCIRRVKKITKKELKERKY